MEFNVENIIVYVNGFSGSCNLLFSILISDEITEIKEAPNDTAYTRWSCHSGLANTVPSNRDPCVKFVCI